MPVTLNSCLPIVRLGLNIFFPKFLQEMNTLPVCQRGRCCKTAYLREKTYGVVLLAKPNSVGSDQHEFHWQYRKDLLWGTWVYTSVSSFTTNCSCCTEKTRGEQTVTALYSIHAPDLQKRHHLCCKVLLFRAVVKAKMCAEHWCSDNERERRKYFIG